MRNNEMSKSYTNKETAIFEAVAQLLSDGKNSHELKVSDIAREAGIGKGTVYEYFPCKNDLLKRSISYLLLKEYSRISKIISNSGSFKDCYMDLLEAYDETIDSKMPNIWALLHSLEFKDFCVFSDNSDSSLEVMFELDIKNNNTILEFGMKEGLINSDTTVEDMGFALAGAVSAYITYSRRGEALIKDKSDERIKEMKDKYKERSWEMLLKILS